MRRICTPRSAATLKTSRISTLSGMTTLMRPPVNTAHSQPMLSSAAVKDRLRANGFQFEKFAIGAPLFHKIADRRDFSVAKDQHFVASFFHVAQKMRGKQQTDIAGLANLANQLDQAFARRRIHPVGRLVQNQDFRAMRNRLRQLRQLLHAERVSAHRPVSRFAQAHIHESLMGPLHRLFGRKSGYLRHVANESNTGHF